MNLGHFSLYLFSTKSILLPVKVCKIAGSPSVANSVDSDQTPRSDLGLYCFAQACLSEYVK